MKTSDKSLTVCISGGFDPLHVGHIRLIKGCTQFGKLVVILNSDKWLKEKHGYVIIPWHERKEMLIAIKGVEKVEPVEDSDGSVCSALEKIKPDIFANGGLRTIYNTPERIFCRENNIVMLYGIGGGAGDEYSNKVKESVEKIYKHRKGQ